MLLTFDLPKKIFVYTQIDYSSILIIFIRICSNCFKNSIYNIRLRRKKHYGNFYFITYFLMNIYYVYFNTLINKY